ncbi:3-oxoacyl-ACP synthase III family protein [Streptantibioticus cattleyicolor]|uniref:3-oxoacyl-(Acyl-carrier-protein) synthase III n=1 Tax=Streptantibioticus cattleyicolor (strain ATCC 35852 / DSM 46488 / JCM 4925 / NBRC 14057 / NRRL 8057) TaxID=1003195 RepID=F8JJ66_STREN|nr:ketoacyl-ACP synthase III [Streptantibioticus cattleyicolor]AEW98833.1 3-oxoacyl-(acyl-carrier-protein) synthase III [Streptantibioticus cattleyicolor NRRL 8057 = DSM 46488]CCB72120.1 3-oxoacyl-(Acyl-carrier-protein) synthase III [Streptantibioticus cattleyicolor NRRL 8057 = DSM 46488]
MDTRLPIGIVSTGSHLPDAVVGNDEIAARTGVTAEWIERTTGVRERRRAAPYEATSDLAAVAAERAIEQAGLAAGQLSCLVVATCTSDHPQPATAAVVGRLIGARRAVAFDVNATGGGFLCGYAAAERMLRGEPAGSYALVVGADVCSRLAGPADPRGAALLGDGAGAVVLGRVPAGQGTLATVLSGCADGSGAVAEPAPEDRAPHENAGYLTTAGPGGRAVAVRRLRQAVERALRTSGRRPHEVRHFVPQQCDGALLDAVWPRLGLDAGYLHLALSRHGNTGSASIPLTLDKVHREGLLSEDDLVLLCGLGGGGPAGSVLLRWTATRYARSASGGLASFLRHRLPAPAAPDRHGPAVPAAGLRAARPA